MLSHSSPPNANSVAAKEGQDLVVPGITVRGSSALTKKEIAPRRRSSGSDERRMKNFSQDFCNSALARWRPSDRGSARRTAGFVHSQLVSFFFVPALLVNTKHIQMNSANISYADELVKEYLLFRGFVKTANQFDSERKTNRLKGFQAGKIVEQLFHYINTYNISALLDLWDYLSRNFFARLDKDFSFTVKKLDISLKRYYVVHCVSSSHMEKMEEFFEQCSTELIKDPEWRPWFGI